MNGGAAALMNGVNGGVAKTAARGALSKSPPGAAKRSATLLESPPVSANAGGRGTLSESP